MIEGFNPVWNWFMLYFYRKEKKSIAWHLDGCSITISSLAKLGS